MTLDVAFQTDKVLVIDGIQSKYGDSRCCISKKPVIYLPDKFSQLGNSSFIAL